jgi:hypothetical protein
MPIEKVSIEHFKINNETIINPDMVRVLFNNRDEYLLVEG